MKATRNRPGMLKVQGDFPLLTAVLIPVLLATAGCEVQNLAALGPRAGDPAADAVVRDAEVDRGRSDKGALRDAAGPSGVTVLLKLNSVPEHSNFTRKLRFTNHSGVSVDLDLDFTRSGVLSWEASVEGSHEILQFLGTNGNRSYWDDVSLTNNGGSTALDIRTMRVHVTYATVSDYIESGGRAVVDTHDETIQLSFVVGRVLAAGEDAIDLGSKLRRARLAVAGIADPEARDTCGWRALVMAVDDLTKTGSDEADGFLGNPKYGRADAALCSEFVSWYYHEAGLVLGDDDLAGIDFTGTLHNRFADEDRMIPFDPVHGDFRKDAAVRPYEPQPGDFLEWRKYDVGYHSMMVLDYDPATAIARVINGPWPVRIRTVDLQAWSQVLDEEGTVVHSFWVGDAQK